MWKVALASCGIGLALVGLLPGCGTGTTRTCSLETDDGRNRMCLACQAGYSDGDVTNAGPRPAGTVGVGPCAAGFARCVIAMEGRVFTTHFLEPGDVGTARMVCAFSGGTFEMP